MSDTSGAGYRDNVVSLREHPGERQLSRAHALLVRNLRNAVDQLQVTLDVSFLEARVASTEVALFEILAASDLSREEAAPEWAVGDEADPELTHGREDLLLDITRPKRVLGLQCRDRMDGVGAASSRLRSDAARISKRATSVLATRVSRKETSSVTWSWSTALRRLRTRRA